MRHWNRYLRKRSTTRSPIFVSRPTNAFPVAEVAHMSAYVIFYSLCFFSSQSSFASSKWRHDVVESFDRCMVSGTRRLHGRRASRRGGAAERAGRGAEAAVPDRRDAVADGALSDLFDGRRDRSDQSVLRQPRDQWTDVRQLPSAARRLDGYA